MNLSSKIRKTACVYGWWVALALAVAMGWTMGTVCGIGVVKWRWQRLEDAFHSPLAASRAAYLQQIRSTFASLDSARQLAQNRQLVAASAMLQELQQQLWVAPEAWKELGDIAYQEHRLEDAVLCWRLLCEKFPYTPAARKAALSLAKIKK
jgi:hypothetical protein